MTMRVPYWWVSLREETPASGYWDQAMLDDLLAGDLWGQRAVRFEGYVYVPGNPRPTEGGVVVLPARHHAGMVAEVNELIAPMPWVVLVLAGDEESSFPYRELTHPNMVLWVMQPKPEYDYPPGTRFIGSGLPYRIRDYESPADLVNRDLDVSFAGQVTHSRRRDCVRAIHQASAEHGFVSAVAPTRRFGSGLDQKVYRELMYRSTHVACPSGPASQDSFRAFEALHHGCTPILDGRRPDGGGEGYWDMAFPGIPVEPILHWGDLAERISGVYLRLRCFAWWQAYRRGLVHTMVEDVCRLAGVEPDWGQVTVLISASPSPSHPATEMIWQTIKSAREAIGEDVEVIVMLDGVRAEQLHLRDQYLEFVEEFIFECQESGMPVLPVFFDTHHHQALMSRLTLPLVRTGHVLFMEHDTPLIPRQELFPVDAMVADVNGVFLDAVRFYPEVQLQPEHEYLMSDEVVSGGGERYRLTRQWSQRPHIARTDWYQQVLDELAGEASRTMIEDLVYGVAQTRGWRIGIWIPDGDNIKTSAHLDGRGEERQFPMRYEYDSPPGPGAPTATSERR